jgi:hypothetical protein
LFAFFGCTGIAAALKERGSKKRKELNNFIRACSLTFIKRFEFLVIVSMVSVKTTAVHKDDEEGGGGGGGAMPPGKQALVAINSHSN